MDEVTENVTMQAELSEMAFMYKDIMDNSDVTSDDHKEAFKNYVKIMELIALVDKQANENSIAWARHDLETKKVDQQQISEAERKREVKREAIKATIDIFAILVPAATTLIKQVSDQQFVDYQMHKMCQYEQDGTLTTYAGKSAWKLVENRARN